MYRVDLDVEPRLFSLIPYSFGASRVVLVVKNPAANEEDIRDAVSMPGSGRCPGGKHGNPLQYSYLENPMDRAAQQASVQSRKELCTTEASWHIAHIFFQLAIKILFLKSKTIQYGDTDSQPCMKENEKSVSLGKAPHVYKVSHQQLAVDAHGITFPPWNKLHGGENTRQNGQRI